MNPYASEDFNRMKVKGTPKPKPEPENENQIDHPFFEGKKLEMSKNELRAFTKAMEQPEFKDMLADYVKEISDPGNKAEYETYLRQLEDAGDLPIGTKLIEPTGLFCIKTTAKKLISDTNKQFFDQKTFINVCVHEDVEKPRKEYVKMPDGKSGYSWQLPYRVSKPRHDQDKNGALCSTFDIVFHSDVGSFIIHDDFKKFVSDTAIDGVNRVMAEHKEKCSSDYKIMKHLQCKGGKPGLLTIKVQTENKLLANADVNKHETKLQKDITNQTDEFKKLQQEEEELRAKAKQDAKALGEIDDDDEDKEEEEQMPTSVVRPKYKIVFSYPANIEDTWEGFSTNEGFKNKGLDHKIPKELTITINVPFIESMKLAKLDINETNMIFEYPDLYYLDLNLKYICNCAKGTAKFDKSKKTLTIRVPITGLTEDSQKVYSENMTKYNEIQQRKYNELERSKREEEEDKKKEDEAAVKISQSQEAGSGESIQRILPSIDVIGGDLGSNFQMNSDELVDLQKLQQEALKEGDGQNTKVDETTQHRENFLKVYSEDKDTLNKNNDDDDLSNLKDIKFKQNLDEDDDSQSNIKITGINDRDVGKKPLIQEIKTTSNTTTQVDSNANNSLPESDQKPVTLQAQTEIKAFSWDTAERVVAKYQFFHQKELVFLNLNFKGYNKLTDVRYALSENELLLEVWHPPQSNQIHRMCYTLNKEVDVAQSNIDLLVDFISIKLKKQDKDSTWNSVGYEISDFTIPLKGQMKSNFLKHEKPVQNVASNHNEDKENINNDNKQVDDGNNGLDDKQNVENQQVEQLQNEVTRKIDTAQLNFMNLDSSVIFKIY